MIRNSSFLILMVSLMAPAAADEVAREKNDQPRRPAIVKKTPDPLPSGMKRFNGMLVGRLVKKDVEKGVFVVNVDRVPRVWRNSKAENPKSVIGKNVEVDGVFGKWLDVLLVVKEGETLEFESRHDGGSHLTFPGELMRKVAPVKPGDYPELPEKFRGFHGVLVGRILSKDPETYELIVKIEKVKDTWKKSRAKDPESVVGKNVMLAGFWRRKETYAKLSKGDKIESGIQHVQTRSDHLTVAESIRKVGGSEEKSKKKPDDK